MRTATSQQRSPEMTPSRVFQASYRRVRLDFEVGDVRGDRGLEAAQR